ncbi:MULTISPECIES: multiubiquitin domain-containing protein [unclassified Mesorhizobium]|uniref:multiubiquitin domain-containing protein n=1 Tax=unclassified Mesorhizobium TaxID=325217 RepID=UPI001CCF356E|nr:multiubiquitin domain-containing protein [Mesorhizobium sp. BH1-1-5]MBZ9991416.1 multiubiquitin domain-containing protein [Mesorhizobium sp. BH1-1-5]
MANSNNNGNGGGSPGHGGGNDHMITIYVNGTPYEVEKGPLSYAQLLVLISAAPLPENQRYAVQYSKGNNDKPTGTLIEGESVQVKKDMEFDVTPATRS